MDSNRTSGGPLSIFIPNRTGVVLWCAEGPSTFRLRFRQTISKHRRSGAFFLARCSRCSTVTFPIVTPQQRKRRRKNRPTEGGETAPTGRASARTLYGH
ncbi:hypothetical protein MTO96_002592 [Rhipicephalus appendiculatus]